MSLKVDIWDSGPSTSPLVSVTPLLVSVAPFVPFSSPVVDRTISRTFADGGNAQGQNWVPKNAVPSVEEDSVA